MQSHYLYISVVCVSSSELSLGTKFTANLTGDASLELSGGVTKQIQRLDEKMKVGQNETKLRSDDDEL